MIHTRNDLWMVNSSRSFRIFFFFFEKQQSNRSKVESWNSKKLNDGYTVCKRERVKRISIRD